MFTCIIHLFIYTHVCAFIFVYERERKEEGEMEGGSQRVEEKGREGWKRRKKGIERRRKKGRK